MLHNALTSGFRNALRVGKVSDLIRIVYNFITGSLPEDSTFIRNSDQLVQDFEGRLVTAKAIGDEVEPDEPAFQGLRRVENLLDADQRVNVDTWSEGLNCITTGTLITPDGTPTARTSPANVFILGAMRQVRVTATFWVDEADYDPTHLAILAIYQNPWALSSSITFHPTVAKQRITSTVLVTDGAQDSVGCYILPDNSPTNKGTRALRVENIMFEEVTGQTNQNPSEFVEGDTKYFTTTNGNTVDGNGVVTEAEGLPLPSNKANRHNVVNNLVSHPNNLTVGTWKWNVGGGATIVDDTTITLPTGGSVYGVMSTMLQPERKYRMSAKVRLADSNTGSGQVKFYPRGGDSPYTTLSHGGAITPTSEWQHISAPVGDFTGMPDANENVRINIGTFGTITGTLTLEFMDQMIEDVTDKTNDNPNNFVSEPTLLTTETGNTVSGALVVSGSGTKLATPFRTLSKGNRIGHSFVNDATDIGNYLVRLIEVPMVGTGHGGSPLSYIAAQAAIEIPLLGPDVKFNLIVGGVNSIIQGESLASMQNSIRSIVALSLAHGQDFIICNITPWKDNVNWTAARQTQTDDFNSWLVEEYGAYKIVDAHSVVEDPANLGSLLPAYDDDTLHLTASGSHAVDQAIATKLEALYSDKGLLIEPARTNYCPYSGDMKQWVANNGNITVDSLETTDVTLLGMPANRVAWTGNAGADHIRVNDTPDYAGAKVAFSFYCKPAEADTMIQIRAYNPSQDATMNLHLDTLTFTTINVNWENAKAVQLEDGVIFVSGVLNSVSGPTNFRFSGSSSGGHRAAGSMFLTGVQAEIGNYPTSLIPTTGVATPRAAVDYKVPIGTSTLNDYAAKAVMVFNSDLEQVPDGHLLFSMTPASKPGTDWITVYKRNSGELGLLVRINSTQDYVNTGYSPSKGEELVIKFAKSSTKGITICLNNNPVTWELDPAFLADHTVSLEYFVFNTAQMTTPTGGFSVLLKSIEFKDSVPNDTDLQEW